VAHPANLYINQRSWPQITKTPLDGLEDAPQWGLSPDIVLSSSALLFCFKHDFGGETLTINGRFEVPPGANRSRFFRWFNIASANSHGVVYDLGYYLKKLARRARARAKQAKAAS